MEFNLYVSMCGGGGDSSQEIIISEAGMTATTKYFHLIIKDKTYFEEHATHIDFSWTN